MLELSRSHKVSMRGKRDARSEIPGAKHILEISPSIAPANLHTSVRRFSEAETNCPPALRELAQARRNQPTWAVNTAFTLTLISSHISVTISLSSSKWPFSHLPACCAMPRRRFSISDQVNIVSNYRIIIPGPTCALRGLPNRPQACAYADHIVIVA